MRKMVLEKLGQKQDPKKGHEMIGQVGKSRLRKVYAQLQDRKRRLQHVKGPRRR